MSKKSLGYVRMEWTCPNCGTRNPGPQKICASCGMPQPEDVQFEQAAQEKLVTDEAELARAKAGPDVHCYYCGSRNPAGAKTCSQCGADLTQATARAGGQVVGAHRTGPAEKITCPACGTPNEADAPKCVQCGASLTQPEPEPTPAAKPPPPAAGRSKRVGVIIGIVALLLMCAGCITFFVLANRTEDATAKVQAVSWVRNIAIEELKPVTHQEWRDQIPAGVVIGRCTEKVHHTESRSTGQTREVCGTPYTVDKGSGFGEVVQDCEYEEIMESVEIYADWCEYTVEEWQQIDQATLSGNDLSPKWPDVRLDTRQREGKQTENYTVTFTGETGTYSYTTHDAAEFAQYQIGSRWILHVNTFDTILSIEPVQ